MKLTLGLSTVVVGLLLMAPLATGARPPGKVWRVGVLEVDASPTLTHLREGMRQLGYVEGRNIIIDVRTAEGKADRLPKLASDLVRLRVDVIVARGKTATRAAKEATGTIPIVMAPADDPVRTGFIVSFGRPGGNITGVSVLSWETAAKQVQLLREVVPNLVRIAVLWTPTNPGHQQVLKEMELPARSFGVQLQLTAVREPHDFDGAFSRMVAEHVGGVIVLGDAMLSSQGRRIVDLAARSRLPAMYFRGDFVEAGGLMSYGTDVNELVRRAAYFNDKILRGAQPGDLPVEQPTKFELVINTKTAKVLGLTIPPSLLLQADRLIE